MSRTSRGRWGRGRREAEALRARLLAGHEVDLPCKARRTTSRGWGEWLDGTLRLPGHDGGSAYFVASDASSAALVTRRGEAPVPLEPPHDVTVRPVRYKTEAFHGTEAEIVVITSERRVVEIAVAADEVEAVARRLARLP